MTTFSYIIILCAALLSAAVISEALIGSDM